MFSWAVSSCATVYQRDGRTSKFSTDGSYIFTDPIRASRCARPWQAFPRPKPPQPKRFVDCLRPRPSASSSYKPSHPPTHSFDHLEDQLIRQLPRLRPLHDLITRHPPSNLPRRASPTTNFRARRTSKSRIRSWRRRPQSVSGTAPPPLTSPSSPLAPLIRPSKYAHHHLFLLHYVYLAHYPTHLQSQSTLPTPSPSR